MLLCQRCHSEGQYIEKEEDERLENEKAERRVWGGTSTKIYLISEKQVERRK